MRISDWSSDVCSSDLSRSPPRDLDLRAILLPDRHPATMRCRVILKPGLRRAHAALIPALDPDRATTTDRKDHMRKFATRSLAVLVIGNASSRERACPYVSHTGYTVTFKKKLLITI